jgi:hypothetical protein
MIQSLDLTLFIPAATTLITSPGKPRLGDSKLVAAANDASGGIFLGQTPDDEVIDSIDLH